MWGAQSSNFKHLLQSHSGARKRMIYMVGAQKQSFQTPIAEPLWCLKRADLSAGCLKAELSDIYCRATRRTRRGVLKSIIFKHSLQSHFGATNWWNYVRDCQKQHFPTSIAEPLWCQERDDLHDGCSKAIFSNTDCRATLVPQTGGSKCGMLKRRNFRHLLQGHSQI